MHEMNLYFPMTNDHLLENNKTFLVLKIAENYKKDFFLPYGFTANIFHRLRNL